MHIAPRGALGVLRAVRKWKRGPRQSPVSRVLASDLHASGLCVNCIT